MCLIRGYVWWQKRQSAHLEDVLFVESILMISSSWLDAGPQLLEDVLLVASDRSIQASVSTFGGPREELLQRLDKIQS